MGMMGWLVNWSSRSTLVILIPALLSDPLPKSAAESVAEVISEIYCNVPERDENENIAVICNVKQ